ncbi:MAG: HAMP domain-containing sensor histidine kinase [Acidimicrobiia bacterium]|nr:HAMP domain-containing sensor histidine kinase [Acidimicrobiia bacterium]MDX2468129.1 HAMP domain-containing sensor histidine kinase [Acidimicrobiia bacterium]
MLGQPTLRRRLMLSYLAVVVAVTATGFVTVQILVPQFFEQAVQERLGPGPSDGQTETPGQNGTPGQGPGQGGQGPGQTSGADTDLDPIDPPTSVATTVPGDVTVTTTTTTLGPNPTGSTIGPGGDVDPGDGSDGGPGLPGGNPDPGIGSTTTTTIEAIGVLSPGTLAAGPLTTAQEVEQSPVPADIQEDYDRALTGALIVATAIGLIVAMALGVLLTRRLLGTFNKIKESASLLADGHYSTRVSIPREVELADLAESVNTLADSLQQTEQTRARLVSDLAHEIRNPLSTIEGYMEGLIDGVLPQSKETYEAIAGEAHRLKRLTWDLSTLSKAQEGAIEFSFVLSDLGDAVRRVVETLGPQYEINEVDLDVNLDTKMPIRADVDRLAQAITNLLGNALAHTPPGGTVAVADVSTDERCAVAIKDSGAGIPQDQLQTIFERFTRLDRDQPGTGIGLNIARTLVRAHGGDVTAESAGPGLGSTFEISLPKYVG